MSDLYRVHEDKVNDQDQWNYLANLIGAGVLEEVADSPKETKEDNKNE